MPSELSLLTAHFGKASFGLSEHQPLLSLDTTWIILVLSVSLAINLLKKKILEGHYLIPPASCKWQDSHKKDTTEVSRKAMLFAISLLAGLSLMQGHTPREHCYSDRDQRLLVTKEPHPRGPGGCGPAPHLPQLLASCLVLGALAQVLHALVLGQEVLLLGIHFVTISLVEQFAEGDEGLAELGGSLGQLVLA